MLKLTPWNPQAPDFYPEDDGWGARWWAVVRFNLPSLIERSTPRWAIGELSGKTLNLNQTPVSNQGFKESIHLHKLQWHLTDEGHAEKRLVGHWQFTGLFSMGEVYTSVAGEYLRDLATGAFKEKRIHHIRS